MKPAIGLGKKAKLSVHRAAARYYETALCQNYDPFRTEEEYR